MHLPPTLLPLASFLLPALSLAASSPSQPQPPPPKLSTATIYHLPVTTPPSSSSSSSPNPAPLAILSYSPLHPHLSHITSFTPPPNATDAEQLTQVVVILPSKEAEKSRLRTSATSTRGLYSPYSGRFRILVDPVSAEVVGASWHAHLPRRQSQGQATTNGKRDAAKGSPRGDFDIVTIAQAPRVIFDKAAKGKGNSFTAGAGSGSGSGTAVEGEEEEVAEKTFLQKYWWLLIGVAVLAMSGGGGEK